MTILIPSTIELALRNGLASTAVPWLVPSYVPIVVGIVVVS